MLTADLVVVRRYKGELKIAALEGKVRERAIAVADELLALASSFIGRTREEFDEACGVVKVAPHERRLADGIRKLIEDRCDFGAESEQDPEALRREVFLKASAARRALPETLAHSQKEPSPNGINRSSVLAEVAQARGLTVEELERALFADLRASHVLKAMEAITPERLIEAYDLAQAQAVLLRAVRIVVEIVEARVGASRSFFRKLKFLRLLYMIHPIEDGGFRVEIDGPLNLFESSTKYGLQLALMLPALRQCTKWRLDAEVRWGKTRESLKFKLEGKSAPNKSLQPDEPARLPDEVEALVTSFRALNSPWQVTPATTILSLPGVGLCVPDLLFRHDETGAHVHLEVMGYWSRDAVWRRVELIQSGLPERVLFAVSANLRVSEAALDEDSSGALYVYKRVLSARTVLERVNRLTPSVTAR